MTTSATQRIEDLLDWVENHGYRIDARHEAGAIEIHAWRQDGAGRIHVGHAPGDDEENAYLAALALTQSVAAEIARDARPRGPEPRRSWIAAVLTRWTHGPRRDPHGAS